MQLLKSTDAEYRWRVHLGLPLRDVNKTTKLKTKTTVDNHQLLCAIKIHEYIQKRSSYLPSVTACLICHTSLVLFRSPYTIYTNDAYHKMTPEINLKADFVQSDGPSKIFSLFSIFNIVKRDHNAQGQDQDFTSLLSVRGVHS